MSLNTTPPEEVTFRAQASTPAFSGMTPSLPSALRNLRRPHNTPKPSEMTVLALRLQGVKLDLSPQANDSDLGSPLLPMKLQFSDSQPVPEKENGVASSPASFNPPASVGSSVLPSEALTKNVQAKKDEHRSSSDSQLSRSPLSRSPLQLLTNSSPSPSSLSRSGPVPKASNLPPASPQLHHADTKEVIKNLEIVEQGKEKWGWPQRCQSLLSLSSAVYPDISDEVLSFLQARLPSLTSIISQHLAERRPSIVSASLSLISSLVSSQLPSEQLAKTMLPVVVEVALGRSFSSSDAIRSVALILDVHPNLARFITSVKERTRLREILTDYSRKKASQTELQRVTSALKALELLERELSLNPTAVVDSSLPEPIPSTSTPSTPIQTAAVGEKNLDNGKFGSSVSRPSSLRIASHHVTPERRDVMPSAERVRSLRYSRLSWRAKLETPTLLAKREAFGSRTDDTEKDQIKGNVSTSTSSESGTQRGDARMYTKNEVEEIRQAAIEELIERLEAEHTQELTKLRESKDGIERELSKERGDNKELRGVLEEFEMTMNKMVSQANSQWNDQHIALEAEKNKLKSELAESSDAFEKLREKYEASKQNAELLETKWSRLNEQHQDLKGNMVELQTWSNQLKANTEKKLSKAFETVTSFRAMYLDREAHEKKAVSDLTTVKAELEKTAENLRVTASKLAQSENDLHKEQDSRAELAGQLAAGKANLVRVTAQRDKLQIAVEELHKEHQELSQLVVEQEGMASQMADIQRQLDTSRSENQELKAKAFDDMKCIEELQREVIGKDKDLDELGIICDEAMNRLERYK